MTSKKTNMKQKTEDLQTKIQRLLQLKRDGELSKEQSTELNRAILASNAMQRLNNVAANQRNDLQPKKQTKYLMVN